MVVQFRGKRGIRIAIAALLLALIPAVALAHGGGTPVLTRAETGPYWLYVFTEPASPRTGAEYHVTIAVTQPQNDGGEVAVENADIAVHFLSSDGKALQKLAEPSTAGPGYYETDVVLPAAGVWQVQVDVNSALGNGSAHYQVEVAAASGMRWGWVLAGVGIVLVGAGLLAYAFTKRTAKDDAPAQGKDRTGRIPEVQT